MNSPNDLYLKLQVLNPLFDIVRLVDPILKEVVDFDTNHSHFEIPSTPCACFNIWKQGHICANCISMRAHLNDSEESKLILLDERVYLISARPLKTTDRDLVLELGKDITTTLLASDLTPEMRSAIFNHIEWINREPIEDKLTHTFSRDYIEERLPFELSRLFVECKGGLFAMINIDHLGLINNAYGYPAGDFVTKAVAESLKTNLRPHYDWAARYDDSTFLVFVNNPHVEALEPILEQLKDRISSTPVFYNHEVIDITMSLGATYFNACPLNGPINATDLLNTTLNNLKEAKNSGRNAFVLTPFELTSATSEQR